MSTDWVKTELVGRVILDNDIWNGQAEETHTYRVYFSDENATGADAVLASGVPQPITGGAMTQLMSAGGLGTGLYLRKRRANQVEDNKSIWLVEITYSALGVKSQQTKLDGQTKWGVDVSCTYIVREETANQDRDKNPIVNSAGEPFEEKLTVPKWDLQVEVSYLTDVPDWAAIDACFQCVNSEDIAMHVGPTVRIFASNTLKFEGLRYSYVYGPASDNLLRMNLILIHRPSDDGWTTYLDDMGYNILGEGSDGSANALVPIVDGNNEPVRMPRYLDGTGQELGTGLAVVRLPFNMLKSVSFSGLLAEIP